MSLSSSADLKNVSLFLLAKSSNNGKLYRSVQSITKIEEKSQHQLLLIVFRGQNF